MFIRLRNFPYPRLSVKSVLSVFYSLTAEWLQNFVSSWWWSFKSYRPQSRHPK